MVLTVSSSTRVPTGEPRQHLCMRDERLVYWLCLWTPYRNENDRNPSVNSQLSDLIYAPRGIFEERGGGYVDPL